MNGLLNTVVAFGVGVFVGTRLASLVDTAKEYIESNTEAPVTNNDYEELLDEETIAEVENIKKTIKKDLRKKIMLNTIFRVILFVILPHVFLKQMRKKQMEAIKHVEYTESSIVVGCF